MVEYFKNCIYISNGDSPSHLDEGVSHFPYYILEA